MSDTTNIAQRWFGILQASQKSDWGEINTAFLNMLARKGELSLLPHIRSKIFDFATRRGGIRIVDVVSAKSLSETDALILVNKHFGKLSTLGRVREDPQILGGVVLYSGEERIDLSIKGKLGALKEHFTNI